MPEPFGSYRKPPGSSQFESKPMRGLDLNTGCSANASLLAGQQQDQIDAFVELAVALRHAQAVANFDVIAAANKARIPAPQPLVIDPRLRVQLG